MNETETETGDWAALYRAARLRSDAREPRGDLLGAESGSGPGRPRRPAIECAQVLVGVANHAGPDGTGASLPVATLVRYPGLSERAVRTCPDRLEANGIISPCKPGIVAARIKRADRRAAPRSASARLDPHPRAKPGRRVRLSATDASPWLAGPGRIMSGTTHVGYPSFRHFAVRIRKNSP